MIGERAERLLLKRRRRARPTGSRRRRSGRGATDSIVGSGQRHVVDRWDAPPHVHERLGRRRVGRRIDELDVRRQRKRDPDQAVLAQVAEIAGALAVDPEVIRVDRPEQRIVGVRIESAPPLEAAGTAPRRWRARAGSRPSPCGSRRTSARCRRGRPACGRRTRRGRAPPRRRARRRSQRPDVRSARAGSPGDGSSPVLALISNVEDSIRASRPPGVMVLSRSSSPVQGVSNSAFSSQGVAEPLKPAATARNMFALAGIAGSAGVLRLESRLGPWRTSAKVPGR